MVGWLQVGKTFSVSSAYELWRGLSDEGLWPGWNLIWSLKRQQRVKTFLWLLAHDRVLTNHNRWRRQWVDNSNCHRREMQFMWRDIVRLLKRYGTVCLSLTLAQTFTVYLFENGSSTACALGGRRRKDLAR